MRSNSPNFMDIREYLDEIPVINSHEHNTGTPHPVHDVLAFLMGPNSYPRHDLQSAAFGEKKVKNAAHFDRTLPFEERYAFFERYYPKARHTAFCRSMLMGLKDCWGITEINRSSLQELQERMPSRDQAFIDNQMAKHRIQTQIADIAFIRFQDIIAGSDVDYSPSCNFAFPLPDFHLLVQRSQIPLKGTFTTLDDYMEAFNQLLQQAVDFGIVCLKNQSAYWRSLDYRNPTKADAEAVFHRLIASDNESLSAIESNTLGDWLFQRFIQSARQYNLPVQIHTGHLAGNNGDIRNANAAHLIPLLGLHSDVKFDLFHANWPYMDEMLFICKNYPNAYLNFCWAHTIDPLYCVEMMKRAVMTVPHNKIIAFGGDTSDIEFTIGHLLMLKDIMAVALSELIDSGWLGKEEARNIAYDWLFHNPNELYGFHLTASELVSAKRHM